MKFLLKLVWDWKRALLHIPVGVVIACVPGILPVCLTMLFLIYELNEDFRIRDHAYIDIQGCLIGASIAGLLRWLF